MPPSVRKKKKYKPSYVGSQGIKKTPAWKVFSEYIRRSSGGVCFTCGIRKHWKELDAGHFIPGSVCGKSLWFSLENVRAQCTGCNRFKHGNLYQFALELVRKCGPGIHERLFEIRREEKEKGIICRFSKEELKEIEEKYKEKLKNL